MSAVITTGTAPHIVAAVACDVVLTIVNNMIHFIDNVIRQYNAMYM